jgi:hypothetical protein
MFTFSVKELQTGSVGHVTRLNMVVYAFIFTEKWLLAAFTKPTFLLQRRHHHHHHHHHHRHKLRYAFLELLLHILKFCPLFLKGLLSNPSFHVY